MRFFSGRCSIRVASLCMALLVGFGNDRAWPASPSLGIILPRGVQRGTTAVLTFHGARLADSEEILFYSTGFKVLKLEPSDSAVKVQVEIAADCRLGEHVAQIRTRSGISDFRTFYVGPFPPVAEKEPNSEFANPQPVDLNVTVEGVVDNEDVDYFVVQAKKGQRISVDVEGMRLGTTLFDPYVAILDLRRFELAASDDTSLVFQDAAVSIVAPEDGPYIIELREASYGGNGNCRYRLHVGQFPLRRAVYPAGGKRGETVEVSFIGDPNGSFSRTVTVPADAPSAWAIFAEEQGVTSPTGYVFRPFDHGNVLEQEPNDAFAQATAADLPLAFNGIIQAAGDVDCFVFEARKGQVWDVECYARRLRSPLDSVLGVYYADGRGIAGNDDSRGPDSYIRFTVPEDGRYVIRVTDHLGRGGPEFVYRIELQPPVPALSLSLPRVDRYSQYRQTIFVPRGNRFGAVLNATRVNFGGDIKLDGVGLPQGISMICDVMPASLTAMPVVFEASADAPLSGQLVDFTARPTDANLQVVGHFTNQADMVLGPPGQSLYWSTSVDRLAIAVIEQLPFSLEIQQPKAPLVRDGVMELRVVAHRQEGFTKPIRVELPFRPPGVGAASAVEIPEGQSEVRYPVNAAGNAATGNWGIFVLGSADVGGAAWASSQLARLEIAVQPVSIELARAACEQGQSVQILGKVTVNSPFEGKARVQLMGLPPKVEAPAVEFDQQATELVFTIHTRADSPVGKHTNIFGQVTIDYQGEPVIWRTGVTELQIDQPLPKTQPAQQAPMMQPTPQPTPPPMEKPLSRLEKLRRAAAQQRTSGNGSP